ncbi:MAG: MFS transporter [Acidimicrobiales bacterium]|nr:MFS transporter [Acidimicrobiales bacterium]
MGVRQRGDQFRRLARSALTDLFDQRRPFGRLALTHILMTAGDTLFAVSLAGSLFFSISPAAAKDKVILYLLLTMGPFAVVAPALGPLVDRSRGARRAMVVTSALGRAVLCPFIARDIHSLLLFPEAFLMLVLSKVYLVTKGALVPEIAALDMEASAGTVPSGVTDAHADVAAANTRADGTPDSRAATTPPYGTPLVRVADPVTGAAVTEPDLATLNARLGLLASLAGFAAAIPAVVLFKLGGSATVLWAGVFVFVGAMAAGLRLPVRRDRQARTSIARAPSASRASDAPIGSPDRWAGDAEDLAALRPLADAEVMAGLVPMSVLKSLVGFVTFLVAFGLRRQGAATWWFGFLLGALTAGALVGVLLVSRARRYLSEQQMLVGALWLVALVALFGALFTSRLLEALVVFTVGLAGAMAKPSFDALVQRHVRELDQGRAFSRFETQLQLAWVLGSFVPVVLSLSFAGGNAVMAIVAAVGALSYASSRRAAVRAAHGAG